MATSDHGAGLQPGLVQARAQPRPASASCANNNTGDAITNAVIVNIACSTPMSSFDSVHACSAIRPRVPLVGRCRRFPPARSPLRLRRIWPSSLVQDKAPLSRRRVRDRSLLCPLHVPLQRLVRHLLLPPRLLRPAAARSSVSVAIGVFHLRRLRRLLLLLQWFLPRKSRHLPSLTASPAANVVASPLPSRSASDHTGHIIVVVTSARRGLGVVVASHAPAVAQSALRPTSSAASLAAR
jgi:hypothetical protein